MLKLAKYLPRHDVLPTVLTVSNPSVPVLDRSLGDDLPPEVEVVRARTFEPGYAVKQAVWRADTDAQSAPLTQRIVRAAKRAGKQFLIPDPQVLWLPAAQPRLLDELWRRRQDVILVSGPPFSQFLLTPLARLASRAAVVLDYRDEWSTYRSTYEMMGGRVRQWIGDPLEAIVLRCAHAVTTATEEFRAHLLSRFPFLDPGHVTAIPNGYDAADFPPSLPTPSGDKLVLAYAGTIFRLTSVRGFLGAVRRLHAARPILARHLEVHFMGRIVETELDAFAGTEELGVKRFGYVDHDAMLRRLAASHAVLCTLDDVAGAERIYPAKIFELMLLRRPCLVLAPAGALTRLVERHGLGTVLPPRDEAAIASWLEQRLTDFVAGKPIEAPPADGIERYDRCALAGEFAAVMRAATARR